MRCPGCGSEYGVPEQQLASPNPRFRCGRCGRVFGRVRRKSPSSRRAAEQNLAFAFDPPRPSDAAGAGSGRPARPPKSADPRHAETGEPSADEPAFVRPATIPEEEAFALGEELEEPESDEDEEEREEEPGEEEEDDDEDEGEIEERGEEAGAAAEREAGAPRARAARGPARARTPGRGARPSADSRARSPLRPVTRGVAAALLLYAALAAYLFRHPRLAVETISHVPILGGLLGDDPLLAWRVELTDLRSGLDQIEGGTRALVVTGRAVNASATPLRIVEVEGRLLARGRTVRRQRVYAANQFQGTLRELSANEVEILLRLEPSRRFRIEPGESARFLLVFPNPPAEAEDVECEVVEARPS